MVWFVPPPCTNTPGTFFSASVTSLYDFFSNSSFEITEIVAAASAIFCSYPPAEVTTIVFNFKFSFSASICSSACAFITIKDMTANDKDD